MRLRLLMLYFRSTKGSQKIFLGGSLGTVPSFSYKMTLNEIVLRKGSEILTLAFRNIISLQYEF